MDKQEFVKWMGNYAMETMREHQVLASVTMAQSILESGWGESELSTQAYNYFGIKGQGDAGSITLPTTEYVNGKPVKVEASFAKFSSPSACLNRRALLFHNGVSWDPNKYRNLVGEEDYAKACRYLQLDGYATDPHYAELLTGIIEEYHLDTFDKQVLHERTIPAEARDAFHELVSRGLIPAGSLPDPSRVVTNHQLWTILYEVIHHLSVSLPTLPAAGELGIVTVNTDNLNVRKGPGTSFDIVGTIHKGQDFKCYGEQDGWYNVGAGWCSSDYVSFKEV